MLKIEQVKTKSQLLKFIKFKIELYKNNKFCVPPMTMDEMNILNPKTNPAFEFCEAAQFLCYHDDKIVGRIGVFINHRANEVWEQTHGRFGWFDFVEDIEVAKLLINTAEKWLRERKMTAMAGPLGFTDLDHEGMLIEGFDQVGTMSTLYNYSYYPQMMEKLGFAVDAKWVEYKIFIPPVDSENRYNKMADIVAKRNNLRILKFKNPQQIIKEGWGEKFFDLINVAYQPLYGFVALSSAQKLSYVKQYIPFVRLELLTMVVDQNDHLIGVGLAMPSLAKALQNNQGRLFPLGFIRVLKALKAKQVDVCDLMLVAVHPDFQNKGVNAMIFAKSIVAFQKMGVKYTESNPELDNNDKIRGHWDGFEHTMHKKRVAFIKSI